MQEVCCKHSQSAKHIMDRIIDFNDNQRLVLCRSCYETLEAKIIIGFLSDSIGYGLERANLKRFVQDTEK